MVDYLVYASIRDKSCTDEEIQKILNSANRNNKHLDITGVLLYTEKRFIQYLEGDKNVIYDLYEKIQKDSRHKSVMLFGINSREERLFPKWGMAGKDANRLKLYSHLSGSEQKVFDDILNGGKHAEDKAIKVIHKLAA